MAVKTDNRNVGTPDALEKDLLRDLRFAGMEKEILTELVSMVAGWQSDGLRHVKVFPLGIPAPDGLEVRGILEGSQLAGLLQKILLESPRLSWVKLFPYGIPFPEMFEIGVHLGSTRQAPGQVAIGQG